MSELEFGLWVGLFFGRILGWMICYMGVTR